MQNAGIGEVTARAADNAEKMDIPNQLPKKRKKRANNQKMKELILHPSKRLGQWRFYIGVRGLSPQIMKKHNLELQIPRVVHIFSLEW